jgi:hypothetical protein
MLIDLLPKVVIPAKAGIQFSSGSRVAFHLPGMTILLPKMSNSVSSPAEPGVYLKDNYLLYWIDGISHFTPFFASSSSNSFLIAGSSSSYSI